MFERKPTHEFILSMLDDEIKYHKKIKSPPDILLMIEGIKAKVVAKEPPDYPDYAWLIELTE